MLQVLLVVVGLLALVKGEIKVTRSRVLHAGPARGIGVGFLVASGLPTVVSPDKGMWVMLGVAGAMTVLAFGLSKKNPLADEIPMS